MGKPRKESSTLPPTPAGEGPDPTDSQESRPPPPSYEGGNPAVAKKMEDAKGDQKCFLRTVEAFSMYATNASGTMEWRRDQFNKLSKRHLELLSFNPQTMFERHRQCINRNREFLEIICTVSDDLFHGYWPFGQVVDGPDSAPTNMDMDKVYSTLRQIVRDYSDEGAPERKMVYGPILEAIEKIFPDRSIRHRVRILCPGSGLNRLPLELAAQGYCAQGNEFSYHMLIVGHYLMNYPQKSYQHIICPWTDNTLNNWSREHQFAEVKVPDLCAADLMQNLEEQGLEFGDLSMIAGDFTEVYAKPDQKSAWEVVATCFFIDCAQNIVQYLEIIWELLVPGGYWISLGPLLYHFADNYEGDNTSIELSFEEVLIVAKNIGFEIVEVRTQDCTYTNNSTSMKQMIYRAAFIVARKPIPGEQQQQKVAEPQPEAKKEQQA